MNFGPSELRYYERHRRRSNGREKPFWRGSTWKRQVKHLTDSQPAEQHKWLSVYRGLMAPSGPALKHPAADMLLDFAVKGCPVDAGEVWS